MNPVCHLLAAAWLGAGLAIAPTFSSAADANAGKTKAQACAVCHGPLGISTAPDAPHLAGQPELYVATQLRAFRSGERRHEVMSLMAKGLSDADITDLAAWFASIKLDARAPG